MTRLIVIGGVAAGMSAASKAVRTNKELQVDVYTDEAYFSYSGCGLPYYAQGVISKVEDLLARSKEAFAKQGVMVHPQHKALHLDPAQKRVEIEDAQGDRRWEAYDKLVLATGARPIKPDLPGVDLKGVMNMKQVPDALAMRSIIQEKKTRHAVIVGGGFIGIEVAEALRAGGIEVTLLEMAPQIMTLMDEDMAELIQEGLEKHGVKVHVNTQVTAIEGEDRVIGVTTTQGSFEADLVLLAIGVKPNSSLAEEAGLRLGVKGAIEVNQKMETSHPDIYAAGDCATAHHLVTGKPAYIPLGTTANKQGKVAGENAAGGKAAFKGVIGTTIFKAIDLEGARTGLSLREAKNEGFKVWESKIQAYTRAVGYPGRGPITVKLVLEKGTDRILGGQIVGTEGSGKRIDVLAALVQLGHSLEDLAGLDLSYAPPFSPVWEPLILAASHGLSLKEKMHETTGGY